MIEMKMYGILSELDFWEENLPLAIHKIFIQK